MRHIAFYRTHTASPFGFALLINAAPSAVSALFSRSCSRLCIARLKLTRFHRQYAYSGYSSTGRCDALPLLAQPFRTALTTGTYICLCALPLQIGASTYFPCNQTASYPTPLPSPATAGRHIKVSRAGQIHISCIGTYYDSLCLKATRQQLLAPAVQIRAYTSTRESNCKFF